MSGLNVKPAGKTGVVPPKSARPADPEKDAPPSDAPRPENGDRLVLSETSRKPRYDTAGEAMVDGATRGAAVGGAIANGAIGAMMIRKGLQGATKLPATMAGKVLPVVGLGMSVWGMASSGVALNKTLRAEEIAVKPAIAQGLSFVGNALIAGGSVAVLTGVGTAPGLVASGTGFVMTAAAALIDP